MAMGKKFRHKFRAIFFKGMQKAMKSMKSVKLAKVRVNATTTKTHMKFVKQDGVQEVH